MPAGHRLGLIPAPTNPFGDPSHRLYLVTGDATAGPVEAIEPLGEVTLWQGERQPERDVHLKIVHINDLHGHIAQFTPYGPHPVFSRIVWRLRELRRELRTEPRGGMLFLSAGDDLIGSVFDELLGEDLGSYQVHAGYRVYTAAGMDAAAVGNHDLDMGTSVLAHAIRTDARFPVLSANLTQCPSLVGHVHPAAIFVVQGVRVGIVGLTTPAQIRPLPGTSFHIADPVTTLHHLLPALKPWCDVRIVLSHLGYSVASTTAVVQSAGDVELARSLAPGDVHLIVGGHTHHVLNEQGLSMANVVNDIPIVQAGTLGRFLGEVDLMVGRQGVAVTNVRLTPTAQLPVDTEFEESHIRPLLDLADALFARPLGRVEDEPDLSTFAVRNFFASGESAMANFVADGLVACCRQAGLPVDLAAVDRSMIRCGLPVGGTLTFGDWFNVMPFADTVRLIRLSGDRLVALLHDNAKRTDRPGEPHFDRGFFHFSRRLRYAVHLGPSRQQARAEAITFEGRPLQSLLSRTFVLACGSFARQPAQEWEAHARTHLGLPLLDLRSLPAEDTGLFLRDLLVEYIRAHGGVTAEAGARRDGRVVFVNGVTGVDDPDPGPRHRRQPDRHPPR